MTRAAQPFAERLTGGLPRPPFPIHADLAGRLAAAHRSGSGPDPLVAHVLATCAGYAYSDAATVAIMMARVGLEENACVRISRSVDAMYVFSTAFVVQSRCGRVAILCFRGTEPATVLNWVGDADVGARAIDLPDVAGPLRVHAGFHRNLRATRLEVLEELELALAGRSLLDPAQATERGLEALYVTGHSLGGAMAALFDLTLGTDDLERALRQRLRAVYTFGQPMVLGGTLAPDADAARRLHRYVRPRDPIPGLPPATWGTFAHHGREYRPDGKQWQTCATATGQIENLRRIQRSVFAIFASEKRRATLRYSLADHAPHEYIAALRPPGAITELGDREIEWSDPP